MPKQNTDVREQAQELTHTSPCPKCGEALLWRESADVGIGIIYGPWGCECGWSESAEYDRREGPAAADSEYETRVCDQWGMAHYSPSKAAGAGESIGDMIDRLLDEDGGAPS